jgi:glycosyltransferase involved in cell wall biosynthesis
MTEPVLSVVVPAYREGPRIYDNLQRLLKQLDGTGEPYEVLVVSDGNADATAAEARRVGSDRVRVLEYASNMGKGFALGYGMRQALGSFVAFIDADMEIDPVAIPTFLSMMRRAGADIVVGSKGHRLSIVHYPVYRRFQGWVYRMLIRLLFNLDVRDTQTGVKLFRRQVLFDALPRLAVKRFAWDLELLVVANHLGYRNIIEGPIRLDYRFESTVRFSSAWRVLWDTAAIFYRLRLLRYYDRPVAPVLVARELVSPQLPPAREPAAASEAEPERVTAADTRKGRAEF